MPLPLPRTLTPSKVSAFTSCPLAFRYSVIDQLPEPPSPHALKGTLLHRTLQLLHGRPDPCDRSRQAAEACLESAWHELMATDELEELGLTADDLQEFRQDAGQLLDAYYRMEDPDAVLAVGLELQLRAEIGPVLWRGIIDRLDLSPAGEFVVVDYKTGRAPSPERTKAALAGVHFYSLLCERALGVRPAEVRLLYLRDGVTISTSTSEQTVRGPSIRAKAVWQAIERACERDDFRPHPSALCPFCSFRQLCPAMSDDVPAEPAEARPLVQAAGESPLVR